mmetsp:Transcript_37892/g.98046  ORF Transcript_37892/g.98046 Transcript_37892/m.98046 type:complete len:194 (-) Transcript_37892:69-650(-)
MALSGPFSEESGALLAKADAESAPAPLLFPTLPAFLVPVAVRDVPRLGVGHKGVFSIATIASGTKTWAWTDRVQRIHHSELRAHIDQEFGAQAAGVGDGERRACVQVFLRQGFVLPTDDQFFNSNPTDAGRFTNHSDDPNCGHDGALRDIGEGEELTMSYGFHGDPPWYREICAEYGVLTEAEVRAASLAGGE